MIVHWVKQRVVAVASKPLRDDRNHLRRSLVRPQAPTFVRYRHALLAARIAPTSCRRSGPVLKRVPRRQASIWSFGCEWFAERHSDYDRGEVQQRLGQEGSAAEVLGGHDVHHRDEGEQQERLLEVLAPSTWPSRAEGLRAVWPDNPEFPCVKAPVLRGLIGCKKYHSDTPNLIATR